MPPTEKHYATSLQRTGRRYQVLHNWIDDPDNKNERHDFTRIPEYGPAILARYGGEGLAEYIEHLREDMETKFRKILGDPSAPLLEAFSYFGISPAAELIPSRDPLIQDADLALLRQAGMVEADIAHSVAVAAKALEIARRVDDGLDLDLVARGGLFHDLGKTRTHAMEHGRLGAELGKELGLPPEITAIMEKHIRGGLSPAEATELGLPVKDYTLGRLEERIIIYADRLVDILTEGIIELDYEREAEERFPEILRTHEKYGKNAVTTERYLGYHREIQARVQQ